jgi:chromosomal replication initiation ATPase DnaA
MTTQLALALPYRTALGRADFMVSACNRAALQWIERWPDWPASALVLHGPSGSGKTHLAELWRARSGATAIGGGALGGYDPTILSRSPAVAVDDAAAAPERALLHLYNSSLETGANLLIIAPHAPGQWPIALPDLASRLRGLPAVAIAPPDDDLLAAVLVKHFADRQLTPQPALITFALRRMERSFAAAARLADRLDRLALARSGPVTLALARQALAQNGGDE